MDYAYYVYLIQLTVNSYENVFPSHFPLKTTTYLSFLYAVFLISLPIYYIIEFIKNRCDVNHVSYKKMSVVLQETNKTF